MPPSRSEDRALRLQGHRSLHDLHHSKHAAEAKGYADAMMLDDRGQVAEATGASIFFVKDGVIHTPTPDCFLNRITRQTFIELAKRRSIAVISLLRRPSPPDNIHHAFDPG